MQSEYDINILHQEAQTRWLKPAEVHFILRNHEKYQLSQKALQKPTSGSLYLFNKRVFKFFRKDGHDWRKKKDGRAIAEAHERLKVGSAEALNCYYAHGQHNPNFQRRSYWMLDPAFEHIVLVHYRDITEGKQSSRHAVQSSPNSSTFILSTGSNVSQNPSFSPYVPESSELHQRSHSPGSSEINSETKFKSNGVDTPTETASSSDFEVKQALRMLEEQLSLGDDNYKDIDQFCSQNQIADDLELLDCEREILPEARLEILQNEPENNEGYVGAQNHSSSLMLVKEDSGGSGNCGDDESGSWKDVLEQCEASLGLNFEERAPYSVVKLPCKAQEDSGWHCGSHIDQSSLFQLREFNDSEVLAYSSGLEAHDTRTEYYKMMFEQDQIGMPLAQGVSLTVVQKQKFTIREISPQWGYATEATKVIIVGSFLCDPTESTWTCMFGDTEVPLQIIQEGVLCCEAPSRLPGKVTLCISSGNQISCSEIREFEYRDKTIFTQRNPSQSSETSKSPDELLLLVRFVQMLLSDSPSDKGDNTELGNHNILQDLKADDDTWNHVMETILDGSVTSSGIVDWLLQELLKDKLHLFLSSRSQGGNQVDCSLTKKEQGIIHMVACLGFEWALNPIISCGVGVNFRDINGWTALHWAARFGREKLVAALVASGACTGAVTDPNPQDPTGKTPASIAASSGHKGLAGYLSELALTTHLSSLTLEETEVSKGYAQVQAESVVTSISEPNLPTDEDHVSLKHTLAAVRNSAQAAARIQAVFRALSFRKRQQREAAASACVDEYGIRPGDIQGLSAMSNLTFGSARGYNAAALSIQKTYRGWKGRKMVLDFRQKVVKIQAHVRGFQARKHYKVICRAVRILDRIIIRWRRNRAGLRGFRRDAESSDESEHEDFLKDFRKQKVYGVVNRELSRVLSMVRSSDARQQYRRMLERYWQAKAELVGAGETSASGDDTLPLDDLDLYML